MYSHKHFTILLILLILMLALPQMGFTANVYPSLPRKVNDLMAAFKPRTKDQEDDIVTTLLEELLALSPKPTPVPGSGTRKDLDLPGSWY